ncbi:MAG: geranylgeranyl reductase, partial [Chitinophagaceae bacterium]|nr:geranylgeranyl reductase [Rubrivivax sp.]
TYAFSGEGIGKAMETGLLAAEALLHNRGTCRAGAAPSADAPVQAHYDAALRGLMPKFDLFETASHINHFPWLADLVVWRAQRSPRILQRLTGVLEETQNPGRLFSWRGLSKLMFE